MNQTTIIPANFFKLIFLIMKNKSVLVIHTSKSPLSLYWIQILNIPLSYSRQFSAKVVCLASEKTKESEWKFAEKPEREQTTQSALLPSSDKRNSLSLLKPVLYPSFILSVPHRAFVTINQQSNGPDYSSFEPSTPVYHQVSMRPWQIFITSRTSSI